MKATRANKLWHFVGKAIFRVKIKVFFLPVLHPIPAPFLIAQPKRSLTLRSPRRNISFTNSSLIESVFEERENEERRKVFFSRRKIVRCDEAGVSSYCSGEAYTIARADKLF